MHLELEERVLLERPKTEVVYRSELAANWSAYKRVIWPVVVVKANENGRIEVESLMEKTTTQKPDLNEPRITEQIEPTNSRLHPCGYWNMNQNELQADGAPMEFHVNSSLTNYFHEGKTFDWQGYLKASKKENRFVAPLILFNEEQRGKVSILPID